MSLEIVESLILTTKGSPIGTMSIVGDGGPKCLLDLVLVFLLFPPPLAVLLPLLRNPLLAVVVVALVR